MLAAELIDVWGALPIWVLLEPGGVSSRLLVARLRAAVARAGLTDAAGAIGTVGDDPAGAVDAMLEALQSESYAVVIDDAHHAEPDAAALIDRIVGGAVGALGHVVVLARYLPPGLERLRRAGPLHLGAAELALRPEETLELCRHGFGLEVSAAEARGLDRATGGWTAAAVLAASRSKVSSRSLESVAPVVTGQTDAMQSILEEALAAGGRDRGLFARIAAPPLLDDELLARITGEPGFLERALAWGLPLYRSEQRWWLLPDPVREHLAALGPADDGVLLTAASHYAGHGAFGTALRMLIGARQPEAAAKLLDDADPWVIDTVDAIELLSVLDEIPDDVVDRYPGGLLKVARCLAGSWMMGHSTRLLHRLDGIVDGAEAPELRRALDVELLVELVNARAQRECEERARAILAALGTTETLTRARALTVLGQALCARREPDGRLDGAALREAADCLGRATEVQLGLGNLPAAATITIFRALWIELPLGRPPAALEALESGLTWAAGHRRRFGQLLFCRAYVLAELGRHDEAHADLEEMLRIGRQVGDRWMVPYAAWVRMRCASLRGDADACLRHAREAQAESETGSWWPVDGSEFLADAADCLDRVGLVSVAAEYLHEARAQPKTAPAEIAMASCALLARHGDPAAARAELVTVERHGIAPRERWRATLFDAYAAFRLGDRASGSLAARAFEQAADLGQPQAPLLRERELAESLLALAAETGMPAARALETASLPTAVTVLGRFELSRGGRPISLGNSQEARLLKLVGASGGTIHIERAIEALWPEVDPRAGRNRLRTVLNRLRDAAPEVMLREGEQLTIGPEVRLDVERFATEARQAQALAGGDPPAAVAVARSAIARYRGPLLPSDPYESWADEPRESAQQTMLGLLDLCAAAAAEQGDLDEARRVVERTIELAPYDDDRYLKVAMILHEQGRKGAALSVLRRARSALAGFGIDPPARLAEAERTIAASGARRPARSTVTPV